MIVAKTERLILRQWIRSDREPFSRLNADPRVMEFMPGLLTPEKSEALADGSKIDLRAHSFGLCAVELRRDDSFIGFIGLESPIVRGSLHTLRRNRMEAVIADCWGQGLATEGAREIVRYASEHIEIGTLVSFTVPANSRSRQSDGEAWHDSQSE